MKDLFKYVTVIYYKFYMLNFVYVFKGYYNILYIIYIIHDFFGKYFCYANPYLTY
jgi:hypothetical protein